MNGCILIDIDMDAMVTCFGSGMKEGNDKANFIHIIHKRLSEIV